VKLWWRESNPQEQYGTALENETFCASRDGLAADWQRIPRHSELTTDSDTDALYKPWDRIGGVVPIIHRNQASDRHLSSGHTAIKLAKR